MTINSKTTWAVAVSLSAVALMWGLLTFEGPARTPDPQSEVMPSGWTWGEHCAQGGEGGPCDAK